VADSRSNLKLETTSGYLRLGKWCSDEYSG